MGDLKLKYWAILESAGIGAISGVVTAGIGGYFGHGLGGLSQEIVRAGAHGFAIGFISELTGGDFMTGFASGSLGSLGGSGLEPWREILRAVL